MSTAAQTLTQYNRAGIYADVSSNAVQVYMNLVHDCADQVLYWNVQPDGNTPLVRQPRDISMPLL